MAEDFKALATLKITLAYYGARLQTDLLHLIYRAESGDRLRSVHRTTMRKIRADLGDVHDLFEKTDSLPGPPQKLTGATRQVDAAEQVVEQHFEITPEEDEVAVRDALGLVNAIADILADAGYDELADDFRRADDESLDSLQEAQALLTHREERVRRWTDPEQVELDLV